MHCRKAFASACTACLLLVLLSGCETQKGTARRRAPARKAPALEEKAPAPVLEELAPPAVEEPAPEAEEPAPEAVTEAPPAAEEPPPPPPLPEPKRPLDLERFVGGPVTLDIVKKIAAAAPERATVRPKRERKLLVYTRCKGFVHGSIPFGAAALGIMGLKTGAYETLVSDDPTVFAPDSLERFDAICMNNTTGELFDDTGDEAGLKRSLLEFVRGGKGLVGIHAATDCSYRWPEYGDMMGGYFWGHPWSETVGVKLDDPEHPLLAAFGGRGFEVNDEIYQFRDPYSRDVLRVILSLDVARTNMNKGGINRTDGDFAVSWVRSYGEGRVFYCSLGHRNEIFWNAAVLRHYLDGLQFATGDLEADTTPVPLSVRSIDPYMGEYVGTCRPASGGSRKAEAKVFPQGGGSYRAVLLTESPRGELSRIELTGGGGGSANARIDVRRTDSEQGPKGVKYAYYEGSWDKLPDFEALTPVKTGTADYFDISSRGKDDGFGFKFTGFVKITEPGKYTFLTSSDDGSRLYIGTKQLLDNDGLHGMQERTGAVELEPGMHPITVIFFEKGGGEGLKVAYSAKPQKEEDEGEGLALSGVVDGVEWKGRIVGDEFTASAKGPRGGKYVLRYTVRKSPTEGKAPPAGAVVLLRFKEGEEPSLAEWTNPKWKALPDGSMEVNGGSNLTRREFGDARFHLEFRIPYVPARRGQDRGNSGVYFQDRYEVQVLDSFGLDSKSNDCGGIYGIGKPKVNACLPPLAWQTYDVTFRAARFGPDGRVTEEPVITVLHNGIKIHDRQKLPHSTTASGKSGHAKAGPIQLQDHGHRVRYRNIWVLEE